MKNQMQNEYQQLCEAIEHQVGRTMQTPLDFNWLSERIFERVHETISPTTLMRLWGYRSGVVPRQATVDILARFLGYADYREFLNKSKETTVSRNDEEAKVESDEGRRKGKCRKPRWWMLGGQFLLWLSACGGCSANAGMRIQRCLQEQRTGPVQYATRSVILTAWMSGHSLVVAGQWRKTERWPIS